MISGANSVWRSASFFKSRPRSMSGLRRWVGPMRRLRRTSARRELSGPRCSCSDETRSRHVGWVLSTAVPSDTERRRSSRTGNRRTRRVRVRDVDAGSGHVLRGGVHNSLLAEVAYARHHSDGDPACRTRRGDAGALQDHSFLWWPAAMVDRLSLNIVRRELRRRVHPNNASQQGSTWITP